MSKHAGWALSVFWILMLAAVPAAAQPQAGAEPAVQTAARPVVLAPSPVGLRLYGLYDGTEMVAAQTFGAVVGKSRLTGTGGGGEVIRIWRGLFVRLATTSTKAAGTRVLVFEGEAIPLDIPLSLDLRHIEYGTGWRFSDVLGARTVGYLGASFLLLRYRETSEFADTDEDSDKWFNGYSVFGGVDVSLWKWIMAGAEVQFSSVPDAIGFAGASEAFGESDLGGVTLRVLVGIRR